jgi:general secretion pathway protein D
VLLSKFDGIFLSMSSVRMIMITKRYQLSLMPRLERCDISVQTRQGMQTLLAVALALMLALLQVQSAVAEGPSDEKTWKVNLKEADIRAFISQVADITGYSFVVDPRVKGKVTVVSNTAMTKEEVYALFNSVLNVHGFASVPSGSVIKLVPNQTAKQDSIPLRQERRLKGEELVTRVIPIINTPAIELVPILRPLIPQYGHLAGVASANALIISDHASNIQRIMEIIGRLDTAESEELEVIQLREAWVGDVVELLQNLEPVESGNKSGRRSARASAATVTVVAEERTNRLIVKGEKSARARIRALVVELDQPSQFSGATKVVYLRHADATKVAEILKNMESERKGSRGDKNKAAEKTNIQADETLNALVIRAQPSEMNWMEDVVRQLDIRRAQVLIEAAIVEVSGDDSNALGIQWASLDQNAAVGGIAFSNLGTNLNSVISALSGGGTSSGVVGLADGISLAGGERNSAGDAGYGALLQAIASSTNTNLLSTPSIMTLDNEEAEIIVGQNVPFITGSTTNTNAGTTNPFQTISREDVGLTLKVVPQINDGDVVRLQVEQEVSSVVPSTEAVQSADLITNKRSIKTTILADDGETLVLGGLIQDDFTDSEQKVPILGDIPVVGRLFKSKTRTNVKRNLLVFLQPRIIRETAQAREITDEKYGRVRTLQLEIDQSGNVFSLFRGKNRRLPEDESDLLDGKRVKK